MKYAADSALLVMDLQPAMMPTDTFAPQVARALAHARQAGMLVVYVVIAFRPGAPEMSPRHRDRLSGLDAAEFARIDPAVAPLPGEPLVVKRRASAFSGSDLEIVLRSAGIRHLILTGMATSGVVLSTLCEASDKDFGLTVLADACSDPDPAVHQVLVEKVFPRKAQVLTVGDWTRPT